METVCDVLRRYLWPAPWLCCPCHAVSPASVKAKQFPKIQAHIEFLCLCALNSLSSCSVLERSHSGLCYSPTLLRASKLFSPAPSINSPGYVSNDVSGLKVPSVDEFMRSLAFNLLTRADVYKRQSRTPRQKTCLPHTELSPVFHCARVVNTLYAFGWVFNFVYSCID